MYTSAVVPGRRGESRSDAAGVRLHRSQSTQSAQSVSTNDSEMVNVVVDRQAQWFCHCCRARNAEVREECRVCGRSRDYIQHQYQPFHANGARATRPEHVQASIKVGMDVNHTDQNKLTPLHNAAVQHNAPLLQSLIENGAEVNATTNQGWRPIHFAAYSSAPECISILLNHGSEVNIFTKSERNTPLHLAALRGSYHACRVLINADADVAATNVLRRTPLHLAALNGNVEVVQLLVRHKAEPEVLDEHGWSPRQLASLHGFKDVEEALVRAAMKETQHDLRVLPKAAFDSSLWRTLRRNYRRAVDKGWAEQKNDVVTKLEVEEAGHRLRAEREQEALERAAELKEVERAKRHALVRRNSRRMSRRGSSSGTSGDALALPSSSRRSSRASVSSGAASSYESPPPVSARSTRSGVSTASSSRRSTPQARLPSPPGPKIRQTDLPEVEYKGSRKFIPDPPFRDRRDRTFEPQDVFDGVDALLFSRLPNAIQRLARDAAAEDARAARDEFAALEATLHAIDPDLVSRTSSPSKSQRLTSANLRALHAQTPSDKREPNTTVNSVGMPTTGRRVSFSQDKVAAAAAERRAQLVKLVSQQSTEDMEDVASQIRSGELFEEKQRRREKDDGGLHPPMRSVRAMTLDAVEYAHQVVLATPNKLVRRLSPMPVRRRTAYMMNNRR